MQDNVAVVTGASRGIGFQIANDLVKSGYQVYGIALNTPAKTNEICFIEFDLYCLNELGELLEKLPDQVSLLINNAGVAYKKPVSGIELDDFRKILDLDFIAPVLLTKALLPRFVSNSTVINISSDVSCMNIPGYTAYAAAKAGLNRFTTILAQENQDLQVYAILPSLVKTDMTKGMSGQNYDREQFLETGDISQVVLDILGGNYQSGDLLVVTNNYLAHWWDKRDQYKVVNVNSEVHTSG